MMRIGLEPVNSYILRLSGDNLCVGGARLWEGSLRNALHYPINNKQMDADRATDLSHYRYLAE